MIAVDATVLIALGNVGELQLLTVFEGQVRVPAAVASEVTTEPAESNLHAFVEPGTVVSPDTAEGTDETADPRAEAKELLGEPEENGDVSVIGTAIEHRRKGVDVAVLSDDRRVRRVAEGLGANVTGTIGVVVRAVSEGRLDATDGKQLVSRLDERGLHMTAELRERADELIESAATGRG